MGFSTAIMHGTLRYYGQMLDEISIILIFHQNIKRIFKKDYNLILYFNVITYLYFHNYYFVFLSILTIYIT